MTLPQSPIEAGGRHDGVSTDGERRDMDRRTF
jgi:hypothetical protein